MKRPPQVNEHNLFLSFIVLHILHADRYKTLDISTQPDISPSANFTDHITTDEILYAVMTTFHDGFLACGGQSVTGLPYEGTECFHFDPHRESNPISYPSLNIARKNGALVKVEGKPWMIGGDGSGIFNMKIYKRERI